MTLYEMNQAGYTSLPRMARSKIAEKKESISEWLRTSILPDHNDNENIYLMLLNNDLHYYTVFVWNESSPDALADEILSVVKNLGTLKSIERSDDNAWEFWVTQANTSTDAYYLFDYTQGVIEV